MRDFVKIRTACRREHDLQGSGGPKINNESVENQGQFIKKRSAKTP